MLSHSPVNAVTFSLRVGNTHDAQPRNILLNQTEKVKHKLHLFMDKAYEGDQTRQLALASGYDSVVPTKANPPSTLEL